MSDLLHGYLEAGLIQFGRFQQADGSFSPLSLNFLLLPSFPQLLQATAHAFLPLLAESKVNRILATRATTALGGVVAVESGIPLTYHYGEMRGVSNAFIIEGAYDVGHPTALLTNVLDSEVDSLLEPAQKVGLNIVMVLSVLSLGNGAVKTLEERGIFALSLLDFGEVLAKLSAENYITAIFHQNLKTWLMGQSDD